jgi:hypothetical protein
MTADVAFEEALIIFAESIYPDGGSVMCLLHDCFESQESGCHNCLGCNFADATSWIHNYLVNISRVPPSGISEAYTFYIMLLYLLVERIYIVFEIVSLPEEYRYRHFRVFFEIHKWANFLKHPKSFLLAHHPEYLFEGADGLEREDYSIVIDQEFVNEYYSGPEKNNKLWQMLQNKNGIGVVFPDPVSLTSRFCEAIHRFISLVKENEVYKEVLASKTTYENYFMEVK